MTISIRPPGNFNINGEKNAINESNLNPFSKHIDYRNLTYFYGILDFISIILSFIVFR